MKITEARSSVDDVYKSNTWESEAGEESKTSLGYLKIGNEAGLLQDSSCLCPFTQ